MTPATISTNSANVFIVDDDEDDQFLLCHSLSRYAPNVRVQVLQDGQELLTALTHQRLPSLVLLDLNMPRMGGLEALGHIRAERSYDSLPIIILTTSDSEHDRRQASLLRATDYLVKPGTVEEMNQLVISVNRQWLS